MSPKCMASRQHRNEVKLLAESLDSIPCKDFRLMWPERDCEQKYSGNQSDLTDNYDSIRTGGG